MNVDNVNAKSLKILVTGERQDLEVKFPSELGFNGLPLEWISLPVLQFRRLPVDLDILRSLLSPPPDWVIFTSTRGVNFLSELVMESGIDFPLETQVACIGEKTAEAANLDGFTPDFYPTEPGSEKFLEEFEHLLSNNSIKPKVLIPMARGGRTLIVEKLRELGCEVSVIHLYESSPKEELARDFSQQELKKMALVLFTSPSSADAFLRNFQLDEGILVGAMGKFTSDYLSARGIENRVLPAGDFERIGEIL